MVMDRVIVALVICGAVAYLALRFRRGGNSGCGCGTGGCKNH